MTVVLQLLAHAVVLSGVQQAPLTHTSPDDAQVTVPPAPQETDCPQLFVAVPQDFPAHVVATGSGTQPHAPPVHERPPSQPGHITVPPQSSVTEPHRSMHHVAAGVGVQHVPFAVHTDPVAQVEGHFAGRPQLLVTVTPHLPRQAVASSGVQQVPSALQTSPATGQAAVALSPHATTWPQLFIATPQFFPAHVFVAGSGMQPQLPLTHAAPPAHAPQSTRLPQLSYSCPHRFAQKFISGTQLPESGAAPASGRRPPSTLPESRPGAPPSDPPSDEELPSGEVVASSPVTTPPASSPAGAAVKSPRSAVQPPTSAVAARTTRAARRR